MVKWKIRQKITAAKDKGKTWLDKQSNAAIVLWAGTVSLIIFMIIYFAAIRNSESISSGAWNLIILIVSSPVAFAIWHFRDKNNRQQIENQRKDINLKEFQKLSEWVSGAHLPEIKTVSKTTQKSSSEDGVEITEQTTEQSEEYAKKPDTADFDTFSKRDGAVALQISAIYNLLPFFRGDYGESFRLPAFNLLKSAWQAMQQESLKKLDQGGLSDIEQGQMFDELTKKASSPIGVALTHVLLSSNLEDTKLNLRDFPEMLPSICLAGMNFQLNGVSKSAKDLSKLKLNGGDFRGVNFTGVNFCKSELKYTKLDKTQLLNTYLQEADLTGARFKSTILFGVNLQDVNMSYTNLIDCQFEWEQLEKSKDIFGMQINKNDFIRKIYSDWKEIDDPTWHELTNNEQMKVLRQFCDETNMLIFDLDGMLITPFRKPKI